MQRVTRRNVDSLAEHVSSGLRDGLRVEVQGRNGYTALDLYDRNGCIRMLSCGTARECYTFLRGMQEALSAVGRDV